MYLQDLKIGPSWTILGTLSSGEGSSRIGDFGAISAGENYKGGICTRDNLRRTSFLGYS